MKLKHSFKFVVPALLLIFALMLALFLFKNGKDNEYTRLVSEYQALDGVERDDDPGHYFQSVDFPAYGKVKYLTAEEAAELKNGIVFFGYPTCPWCRNTLPLIFEVCNEKNLTLYYSQLDLYRDEFDIVNGILTETVAAGPGYADLTERLSPWLDDYILMDSDGNAFPVGEKRIYAPSVAFFKNGEVVAFWELNLTLKEDQSKYDPWTPSQKDIVKDSFTEALPAE